MTDTVDDGRPSLTREALVLAARSEIERNGLDSLSLRKLAASLGVTAPALYGYVDGKRDLLRAVAEQEFAQLLERFDRVAVTDPVPRLRQLSRVYVESALERPELFRAMFVFPPEMGITAATGNELALATTAFNYAEDSIRAAVEAGTFRADLDPALVSFTVWTATHGLATVLLLGFPFDDATKELLIDTVLDTVIAGLRPTGDQPAPTTPRPTPQPR